MFNLIPALIQAVTSKLFRLLWLHSGHAHRMLDKVTTGICILKYRYDLDKFQVIYSNISANNILGYDPVGKDLESAFPSATEELPEYNFKTIAELYRDKLFSGIEVNRVLEYQTKLYGVRYFEQSCIIYGTDTLLVTFTDISNTYTASITDGLTQLYTRVYLEDQVKQAILKRCRGGFYTFIRLDLNKFKRINDEGNHLLGDKCLVMVARRLQENLRGSDIIARIGGDEFACLLPGSLKSNLEVINRLNNALTFEVYDNDEAYKSFPVSAAIGVTAIEEDDDYSSVNKRADRAQIRAKSTKTIEIETI